MKILAFSCIILTIVFLSSCSKVKINTSEITTYSQTTSSDIQMNLPQKITRLNFVCAYKKYLYISYQNQILKFSQDLSSKEVVYTNNDFNNYFISDFMIIDESTLYIRLTDNGEPRPIVKFITIDLKSMKSTPLFKENKEYSYGVPVLMNDNIYYSRYEKEDFQEKHPSIIKRDFFGNETVILKDIYYYNFYNSKIYYMTEYSSNTIYSSNLDGGDVKSELSIENDLIAFEIYNDRIYYDIWDGGNDSINVYELSTKKTVNLGSTFYRSTLFFNDKFAFALETKTGNLLKINTNSYSTTSVKQNIDLQNYSIIDDWIYAQNINADTEKTHEVNLYRMKLDGTSLEKIN